MENGTVTKGVGIGELFKAFTEPEDNMPKDEQKALGGEEIKLIWSKVWKGITKRGIEITEKGVTVSAKKPGKITQIRVNQKNKTSQTPQEVKSMDNKNIDEEENTK